MFAFIAYVFAICHGVCHCDLSWPSSIYLLIHIYPCFSDMPDVLIHVCHDSYIQPTRPPKPLSLHTTAPIQVLLWTKNIEETYAFVVTQNNKWELDGRGANAFAGIAWLLCVCVYAWVGGMQASPAWII